ncbi:transcriptional regulator [Streptococcus gallolyticus subsp. gallolyticus]|uniref:transcriptional regulator n=1 Tax=Streptococcus gallolyticus TaxID=315405 RepID=UPI0022853396|nr:transcriptional regulator [Streptococcus gallolyticus]MCY7178408.1 transcriptional regulator [Streptococcus gallolyticus subsp. gallolyticus]
MTETIETILLTNLFYFEHNRFARNEDFILARRRKAIALLDEDLKEFKAIDERLAQDYQETIAYLETLSDEDYQTLKEDIIASVDVN